VADSVAADQPAVRDSKSENKPENKTEIASRGASLSLDPERKSEGNPRARGEGPDALPRSGLARPEDFTISVERALRAQLDGMSFDKAAVRTLFLAMSRDHKGAISAARIEPEATRWLTLKSLQNAEERGASAVLGIPFQPLKDAWLAIYGEFSKGRQPAGGAGLAGASGAALAGISNDPAASVASAFLGTTLRQYFADLPLDNKGAALEYQQAQAKEPARRFSLIQLDREDLLAATLERMRRATLDDQRPQMLAELAGICKGGEPDFIHAIFSKAFKHPFFQKEISERGELPFIRNLMHWAVAQSELSLAALDLLRSLMISTDIAGHIIAGLLDSEHLGPLFSMTLSNKPESSGACHVLAALARQSREAEAIILAWLDGRSFDSKDDKLSGRMPADALCMAWKNAFVPTAQKVSSEVIAQKNATRMSRADLLAVYMLGSEKRIEQVVSNLGNAPVPHMIKSMRGGSVDQSIVCLRFLASLASFGGERASQLAKRLRDDDWKWLVLNARSNNAGNALTQLSLKLLTALCEDPETAQKLAALYHSTFEDLPTPRSELILEQIGMEPVRPGLELMIDVAGLPLKVGDEMQEPSWRAEKAQLLEKLVRLGVALEDHMEKIFAGERITHIMQRLADKDCPSDERLSLFSVIGTVVRRTDQLNAVMSMLNKGLIRELVDAASCANLVESLPFLRLLEMITSKRYPLRQGKDVWGEVAYCINADGHRKRIEALAYEGSPAAVRLLERFPEVRLVRSASMATPRLSPAVPGSSSSAASGPIVRGSSSSVARAPLEQSVQPMLASVASLSVAVASESDNDSLQMLA